MAAGRRSKPSRKLNQCGEGQPWDKDKNCTLYPSKIGAPVITAIHPGTHTFPKEAPAVIVKFFKEQVKPWLERILTQRRGAKPWL